MLMWYHIILMDEKKLEYLHNCFFSTNRDHSYNKLV